MLPENSTVGTPAVEGAEGQPVQPVSPTPAAPIEGDAIKMLTELRGQYQTLEKELRGLQGRQDRNDNAVSSFQSQLATFNQIKAQGGYSDEQALSIMEKQKAEEQRWRKFDEVVARLGGIGTTPTEQQMVAEVLADFKLDPKDTYVASQLQGKQFASRAEAEAFAGRLLRDKVYSPNPTQAQAASSPMSGVTGTRTPEVVYAEYEEAFKNPSQNADLLAKLEEEMRRL